MLQSYIACREHKHDIKDPNLSQEAHGHRDVSLPCCGITAAHQSSFSDCFGKMGSNLKKPLVKMQEEVLRTMNLVWE
jgi:hypothetical protein